MENTGPLLPQDRRKIYSVYRGYGRREVAGTCLPAHSSPTHLYRAEVRHGTPSAIRSSRWSRTRGVQPNRRVSPFSAETRA